MGPLQLGGGGGGYYYRWDKPLKGRDRRTFDVADRRRRGIGSSWSSSSNGSGRGSTCVPYPPPSQQSLFRRCPGRRLRRCAGPRWRDTGPAGWMDRALFPRGSGLHCNSLQRRHGEGPRATEYVSTYVRTYVRTYVLYVRVQYEVTVCTVGQPRLRLHRRRRPKSLFHRDRTRTPTRRGSFRFGKQILRTGGGYAGTCGRHRATKRGGGGGGGWKGRRRG